MPGPQVLRVALSRPPRGLGAGLYLARGNQKHPDRRIGEYELFFVRRGRVPIVEAGRDVTIGAGETLILWPHRRHYGTAAVAAGAEFYWLHFAVDAVPARAAALSVPQRARPARPERLMELLHRYLHDREHGRLTATAASLLVMLMLSEIGEQRDRARDPVDAGLAERAEASLARRFHLGIGTAGLARALGCNPDHLGRSYRRAFGRTIMDAIGERRIGEAKRLLLTDPGRPIADIAAACGCPSLTWFRRLFRRVSGTTPQAFRRAHARAHINS